jgi:hypothetical protein
VVWLCEPLLSILVRRSIVARLTGNRGVVDANKSLLGHAASTLHHGRKSIHLELLVVDSASEVSGMADARCCADGEAVNSTATGTAEARRP